MVMDTKMELSRLVDEYRACAGEGKIASYIPALAKSDASHLGICIITPDGTMQMAGEWDTPFTLQSISKVISFVAACTLLGVSNVLQMVDVEPTGDPFNSIIRLEMHKPGRPFNPMINAGAITVSSLLPGSTPDAKLETLLTLMERITGKRLRVNQDVFQSEWETANRNRSLAFYLKDTGYLQTNVDEALETYLKQCSIEVNAEDLAMVGLVLAQDGYHPLRKEQLIPKEVAKIAKALMLTCGMYNASGKFAAFVGVPAKSGVSGGILAAVPPRAQVPGMPLREGCGIGIYGPAIDEFGNSVAGVQILKRLAAEWELSIF